MRQRSPMAAPIPAASTRFQVNIGLVFLKCITDDFEQRHTYLLTPTASSPKAITKFQSPPEVRQPIAQGRSNCESAEALFVTEHTVKHHVASLFSTLDVTSRDEAVARAASLGLLPGRT